MKRRFLLPRFLLALGLILLAGATAPALVAQPGPRVERVEPPHWWVSVPPNPLLVLVYGENFSGGSATTSSAGVRVLGSEASSNGRYLFIWLEVSPAAQPGPVALEIRTPAGSVPVPFSLEAPRPREGHFQGLSRDDVIYLIMPDRFANGDPTNDEPPQSPGSHDRSLARAYHGGDPKGIQQKLPYLRDLGVTALWLNPVYDNHDASPQDYHGYGAVNYFAVDEHLGTVADLEALVQDAHSHGIKIFLDNVLNHTGPHHPWVAAPPLPDWLHGTAEQHLTSRAPFETLIDPHAPPRLWRDLVEGWFAGLLPDLNQENPRVAQYLLQKSIWWAEETGLDGYRLDTYPYLQRSFWQEWHQALFRQYPQMDTIGEVFHPDVGVTAFFAGGQARWDGVDSGVTTVFDFPLYFALRDVVIRGAPVARLVEVFQRDWLYARPERLVTFLGNHDVKRFISEPGSSKEKLKLAFALLLTVRGIPQLYYGDEIGMEGGDDPDNRQDFPGGWPADPRDAFTREGRTAAEEEIFSHLRALLHLRATHPALRNGRQWHLAWDEDTYTFMRETPQESLVVVFNKATESRRVSMELKDTPLEGNWQLEPLFGAESPAAVRDSRVELTVGPQSLAIYRGQ